MSDDTRADALAVARAASDDRNQHYARAFGTDDGKWVLEDIERDCYVYHTVMTRPAPQEHIDIYETIFREGMRTVALRIKHRVRSANAPPAVVQQQAHSSSVEAPNERSES